MRAYSGRAAIISAVVTVLLTAGVLWHARAIGAAFQLLGSLNIQFLTLAVVLVGVNVMLAVARWWVILAALGGHLRYRECLVIVLALSPLALITPFRASDLLRGSAVRKQLPLRLGIGSVVVEKMIDLPVLVTMAALGAFALQRTAFGIVGLLGTAVFTAVVAYSVLRGLPFAGVLPTRLARVLDQMQDPIRMLVKDRFRLTGTVFLSAAGWSTNTLIISALLSSVGSGMSIWRVMAAWPLALLVGLLPLTLAGLGTRDAAFLALTGSGPAESAAVLTATLLYFAIAYVGVALVGLAFVPAFMRGDPECSGATATKGN